jgi:hypothetical protein
VTSIIEQPMTTLAEIMTEQRKDKRGYEADYLTFQQIHLELASWNSPFIQLPVICTKEFFEELRTFCTQNGFEVEDWTNAADQYQILLLDIDKSKLAALENLDPTQICYQFPDVLEPAQDAD